ncbi:MAG: alpha/beta hydrolase [Chloroflexi bacterium]|nr:alpha/beta hydrolase [Chloroflexota bacterium]MBV9595239.1 alpha/beta hydrolase [Chloroflexota bacterium]
MTATADYTTDEAPVGQTRLYVLKGGSGPACLVLHGIEGHEGWLTFHAALARSALVLSPSHPGYGQTPAPEWITSVPHQAIFYHWYLQQAGLQQVDLVGVGLGGWIAATMAVMDSSRLRHLALVDAAGLRPTQGEMLDVFVTPWRQVIERGFLHGSEAPEYQHIYSAAPIQDFGGVREAGRTMSMRMCFKPYMHDPSLAGMLPKITTPTLVVWGEDDALIPIDCAHQYQRAIPGATLRTIDNCGHFAHLDQPERLAEVLQTFFSA